MNSGNDLVLAFQFLKNVFAGLLDVMDSAVFNINGINVSYLDMVLGALAIGLVVTVFWRGSKT